MATDLLALESVDEKPPRDGRGLALAPCSAKFCLRPDPWSVTAWLDAPPPDAPKEEVREYLRKKHGYPTCIACGSELLPPYGLHLKSGRLVGCCDDSCGALRESAENIEWGEPF